MQQHEDCALVGADMIRAIRITSIISFNVVMFDIWLSVCDYVQQFVS